MNIWDFLSYTVPSQEVEIWIKSKFAVRYTRYTTDVYDEIRNDDSHMEQLKNTRLSCFSVNSEGTLVVHGIESL